MTTLSVPARSRSGMARLGGVLTIGSARLLVVAAALGIAGQPVGLGSIGVPSSGGLVLPGGLALAAVGLGLIAVASSPPLLTACRWTWDGVSGTAAAGPDREPPKRGSPGSGTTSVMTLRSITWAGEPWGTSR